MAAFQTVDHRHGRHAALMGAAAPLALAAALAAGPAWCASLPIPNVPPPASVSRWVKASLGPSTATSESVAVTGPRAYAEWQEFNLAAGNTFSVTGQQADWILVDRVVGPPGGFPALSTLSGHITAAGQVWLINPAGIAVTKTGVFDVAGLLLSTAFNFNLTGANGPDPTSFLGGSLTFNFGGANQSITMDGTVNASKGVVALLAPFVSVGGKVLETAGGSTQFTAVAARDVSLVFTDVGTTLALDGVTITTGVAPPDVGNPPDGGVVLGATSAIRAGRIFVAAAGESRPSQILATGALTATRARGDGQDIVLMTADNAAPFFGSGPPPPPPSAELAAGLVQAGATTTTTGGAVTVSTTQVNTTAGGVKDPAAADGAGLMIRAAGDVVAGAITNAVGDVDIRAIGNIAQTKPVGKAIEGRDIALQAGGTIKVAALVARDDVVVRGGAFDATSIAAGQTVAGQAPVDVFGAADRLIASAGPFTLAGVKYDLAGHDVDVAVATNIAVTGAITAAPVTGSKNLSSDVRLGAFDNIVAGDVTADRDILMIAGTRGGSITAGNLKAGRDVGAIAVNFGPVTLASAEAGDDIVLRSPAAITVTGALTTDGLDVSPAAAGDQAGDLLAGAVPMTAFGHKFDLTGATIDLVAGTTIQVGGQTTAKGAASSARFQANDGISLAGVTAGADVLVDADLTDSDTLVATGVVTGDLKAGRDIGIRSTNADITLGSADAGDDIVLRSGLGVRVNGGLATHGADVSPAAAPDQAGDLLVASDPITAFGHTFGLTGSDIDVKSAGGVNGVITVKGQSTAAGAQSDVRFQANNAVTVVGVAAGRDILIDGDLTDLNSDQGVGVVGGDLKAGRDVAVRSLHSSLNLASAEAGDDVVLRSPTSTITVTGALKTDGVDVTPAASADQAGELLFATDPMTAFGFKFDLTGSNIDVKAAAAIAVGGQSTATGVRSDARFQTPFGVTVAGVTAGQDVLIDSGGAATAGALVAGRDIGARSANSNLTLASGDAGDDIVLRSPTAVGVTAGLTTHGLDVPAATSPNQAGDLLAAFDPMTAFGFKFALAGSDIDVKSGGTINVGGPSTAAGPQSDVRFQSADATTVGDVTAGRDVLIDADLTDGGTFVATGVVTGALRAGRDIGVRSTLSSVSLASGKAGDDIVLRSPSTIVVTGALTTLGQDVSPASGPDQAGDLLTGLDPITAFGFKFAALTGSDIDVKAGGAITVGGPVTASGANSDGRFQSPLGVTLASVTVGEDLLVDAGGAASAGAVVAGRDIGIRSAGFSIALASAQAGDDIVLRSPTTIGVTGALTTNGQDVSPGAAPDQAGDLLVALAPMKAFGHTFALTGSDIDVVAGNGVTIGGQATAGGSLSDVRIQAPLVRLAGLTAGEDVLVDGSLFVFAGVAKAARDVGISAGSDINLASADAGDDIVLRAGNNLTVTGALTTHGQDVSATKAVDQAGDLLVASNPIAAFGHTFDASGSTIDVKAGFPISVGGQVAATGPNSSARFQSQYGISLAGVTAGQDVLIDADASDVGSGAATGVVTGALVAGRDIGVRSQLSTITIASGDAGDDIVLRSPSTINVGGALTTHGLDVSPAASPDQAGDLLATLVPMTAFGFKFALAGSDIDIVAGGALTVKGPSTASGALSDARFQSPLGVTLAGVTAGEDVLIDGGGAVSGGALVAGRDVGVRSSGGSIALTSAVAGDDIVLRSATATSVTGSLTTKGADVSPAAAPDQAGDLLAAIDPMIAFGFKFTVSPGSDIDVKAGGAITVGGAVTAAGLQSDARFQSGGTLTLAGVTAGEDVLIDGVGAVIAGAVAAQRDLGIRALRGSITLASGAAGDDIVLRSSSSVSVTAGLTTGGKDASPASAAGQSGDLLAALVPMKAFGATFSVSPGSTIDVVAGGAITVGGPTTASGALSDARFQSPLGVTLAGVNAGEDLLVDGGGAVLAGAVAAGRDIGVRSSGGSITLASAQAADDIVLRSATDTTVTGALTTGGKDSSPASAPDQSGDLLAAFDPMTAFGFKFSVSPGSAIDVKAGGAIMVGGAATANGALSDVRFQTTAGVTLAGVTAGQDVLIDGGGAVGAGALVAGRDVGVRSSGGSIALTSAMAGDDIVLRSAASTSVTGSLTTKGADVSPAAAPDQAGDLLAAIDPMTAFGFKFTASPGSTIDVKAGGAITVGGPTTASGALSDARFQSPLGVTLAGVNAGEDLLVDGGGAVLAGAVAAGRDIGVRSLDSSIALASGQAGDDIVLRSATDTTVTGALTTGGTDASPASAPGQSGDLLAALAPMKAFGATFSVSPGSTIDVVAGGAITVGGPTTASGALSDARFQAVGATTLGGVTAGEDVLIDGGGAVSGGALVAGRDVGVRSSGGSIALTSAVAGDDIVLRSATATSVTGSLTTKGADVSPAAAPDQAGDLLAAIDPMIAFGFKFTVSPGSDIDVKAGGAITVGGAVTAAGLQSDARFQSGGTLTLAGVTAGEDVLIDGVGAVIAGAVAAQRDLGIRALRGSITLASGAAGDDIVLRSSSSVSVTAGLTTGGKDASPASAAGQSGDLLAALAPMKAFGATFSVSPGSTIDVVAGGAITVGGPTTASGALSDARFQSPLGVTLAGVNASEDLLVDGGGAILVGAVVAGRDIGVRSSGGSITLASAQAADDIVLRSATDTTVTGALTTGGTNASPASAPGQSGDLLAALAPMKAFGATFSISPGSTIDVVAGGAITVGGAVTATGAQSDAHFQSVGATTLSGVNAGEDILIDGGGAVGAGALIAGRDVGVRSSGSSIILASAQAGDDIVLRAPTTIGVTGGLATAGQDVSQATAPNQAGDLLAVLDPLTAFGVKFTVSPGSAIDVKAGGTIAVGGPSTAVGAQSDARFQTPFAVTLGAVTAGEDVLVDGGGAVMAGALIAGRDVGVRSSGSSITLASAQAADDVVLRSPATISIAGAVSSGQGVAPAASASEAGDLLAALDPIHSYWAATPTAYTTASGHDVDIRSGGAITVGGAISAGGAGSDVRLDAFGPGATVSVASIALTGGAGGEQVLVAASDFNVAGAIDAPGADVLLFARQAGTLAPVTLGGPATGLGAGFTFDGGEVARTTAASLDVFSGTDPKASADIAIQDLTLGTGLRTLRVFAGAGARAEVFGQVVDGGGGGASLAIGAAATDPNLPKFGQAGGAVAMSAIWTPDVVRISGGVGTTSAAFSDVSLAGQSIYIAPRNDSALGKDFEQSVGPGVKLAEMPTYGGSAKVQIVAGNLETRASGEILQRNLETGFATEFGQGLEIGRLTIDRLAVGGPVAGRVNLYGVIDKNLAGVIPPANSGDLIGGILPAIILHFSPFPKAAVLYPAPSLAVSQAYKFNNCVFGGGGCLVEPFPPTLPPSYPGILPFIPHPDDIGNVSDPYTPVEEEPVTNVGGEVEWLPTSNLTSACPNDKMRSCDVEPPVAPSSEVK